MLRLYPPLLYKGKYIPVGRRVFRETLIKGRKQKSPIILLPPYISVHELRLMLNTNYDICFKAANVYKCKNKYTWRDSENRIFQTVNKRNVIIPYNIAAYVSKIFHFKPKLIEVELKCDENQCQNISLSEIYKKVYKYEEEFQRTGKTSVFEKKENKKEFTVASVIGHINHGKTTLLDKITNNNLALSEAGCITQNIKAIHFERERENSWNENRWNKYQWNQHIWNKNEKTNEKQINEKEKEQLRFTFLDTPGHEVFQIFRGRAAFLSDVLIILISLEVGAEIQTEEAIKYADKFNIPVIFALNKCDIYYENEHIVKAELKKQCQYMFDTGDLKRDYSTEINNSICISASTGYNLNKLINRLYFFSQIINLPYHSVNDFYNSDTTKKDIFLNRQQSKESLQGEKENNNNTAKKKSDEFHVLQKYIRKSDCLLALDCKPFGMGIVIDISKDSSRGTLLNVVIRNGYFMEGNYFICGSAYGKIQKMYKHNTDFKENCTYATIGMAVQISGIKKYGNATTDDLIFTLPQNNAFRLCQYRLMVEKLCSLQISGSEIHVTWENDMKKNEYQAENIYENRLQMSQKRKAIEEFGVPNNTIFKNVSVEDFHKSNSQLKKEEDLIEMDLEEEKEEEMQIEKKKKIQNIISAQNSNQSILISEDKDALVFFDSLENRRKSLSTHFNRSKEQKTNNNELLHTLEHWEKNVPISNKNSLQNISDNQVIEDVVKIGRSRKKRLRNINISNCRNEIEQNEMYQNQMHQNEMNQDQINHHINHETVKQKDDTHISQFYNMTNEKVKTSNEMTEETNAASKTELKNPTRGRKNKRIICFNTNEKYREKEIYENEKGENDKLKEPWYYEKNEKLWIEKVLKRNEELTEKWRGKTKQREIEQERQKLYEKKMILQNEIMKRNLLGEEKLTEEEIHRYLYEDTPKAGEIKSSTNEEFHLPQKNCPVIPIIIRTNYVGMFDIFLDEFEKLQKKYNVKIAVVHGGVGPIIPNDVIHAEVESEFGYCCIYAFQVEVLPDSVKQALLSKIVIKQYDVFTDLIDDIINRIKNIKTLIRHNMYVRSLKTENS